MRGVTAKNFVHLVLLIQFLLFGYFLFKVARRQNFSLYTSQNSAEPSSRLTKNRLHQFFFPNSSIHSEWANNSSQIQFDTKKYSKHFCVAYNVTKATGNFRADGLEPISLVVHATSNFMRDIEGQCSSRNWNGPISVALFVDRFSGNAVDYIHEVHRCSTKVNQKLSVHVVYRMSPFQTTCDPIFITRSERRCSNFTALQRSRERGAIIPPFQIYPINVMRNVARKGALSDIHMMADVEMVFSEGFALKMKKLANKYINGVDKNLIVIRRFEVDNKAQVPKDHMQLFLMIKAFRAFEFHHKYFPAGHTIESLWQWFRMSKNTSETYAWEIDYKSSSWEAQMLLHRKDPYNPEYIPTRIRDQQSLVYELCRAEYTFYLASHVFNVHRGVKTSESNMSSAVLTHQRRIRTRAFKKFIRTMNDTYPDTYKRCGKFIM